MKPKLLELAKYGEREQKRDGKIIKANLRRYHLHSWRHGLGHYLATNKISIEDAKMLLGHDDIKYTDIYFKHSPEEVHEEYRRLPLLGVREESNWRKKNYF